MTFDCPRNLDTLHLSQRYYDPATASFITKDPAKADAEESAYQYCGGDPVGKTDPSGMVAYFTQGVPRRWSKSVTRKFSFTGVVGFNSDYGVSSAVSAGSNVLVGPRVAGVAYPAGGTAQGYVRWDYAGEWMKVTVTWTFPGKNPMALVVYRNYKSGNWKSLPWSRDGVGMTSGGRGWVSCARAVRSSWVRDVKVKPTFARVKISGPKSLVFTNPRWGSRPTLTRSKQSGSRPASFTGGRPLR
jgi:hypothetical protein